MRFIEKTDCKLSVSNGSVNTLNTYKIQTKFVPSLDFVADSSRCSWMISNLLYRIWWQLTSDESLHTFRLCTGRNL